MTAVMPPRSHAVSLVTVLCYLFGPVSGSYFLYHPIYRHRWEVRFHAAHSLLMSGVFIAGWLLLTAAQALSPWFLSVQLREMRWCGMVGSIPVWILAMLSAYRGDRFVAIPMVHELAVKLARHVERNQEGAQ